MGSNVHPTPNGQYIIGGRNKTMMMDSRTYGLSLGNDDYVVSTNYVMQMSHSGVYVHGTSQSTQAQSSVNQSHGCINVTNVNTKWFLDNIKRGDIVIIKNTVGEALSDVDGLGDWNIPWETWKEDNTDGTSS